MKLFNSIAIAATLFMFACPAWAASTKQEVIELRKQVETLQEDISEIKKLLEQGARAPAAPAAAAAQGGFRQQTVTVGSAPYKGAEDAPVTVMEFSDYQCPFCARNYRDVLPLLQQEYIDTGKVRFVMREYPLPTIHKEAMNASMAALCAHDQGKYWEMHNALFDNQRQLNAEAMKGFAADLGLDTSTFNACLDDKKHEKTVQQDLALADKLGVQGTPGFVIGLTNSEDPDKVDASVYIKGAKGIDSFRGSINALLESAE